MKINLKNMSCHELEALSKRAANLAKDLRGNQPSDELALEAGVEDVSYTTVRHGLIPSFRGIAELIMSDGRRWKCIGHGPSGTAQFVSKNGFIEFIPMDD